MVPQEMHPRKRITNFCTKWGIDSYLFPIFQQDHFLSLFELENTIRNSFHSSRSCGSPAHLCNNTRTAQSVSMVIV